MGYKVTILIKGLPDDEDEYEIKLSDIECALSGVCDFEVGIGEPE